MITRFRVWCCSFAILLAWANAAVRAQDATDRGLDIYFIDVEGGGDAPGVGRGRIAPDRYGLARAE